MSPYTPTPAEIRHAQEATRRHDCRVLADHRLACHPDEDYCDDCYYLVVEARGHAGGRGGNVVSPYTPTPAEIHHAQEATRRHDCRVLTDHRVACHPDEAYCDDCYYLVVEEVTS